MSTSSWSEDTQGATRLNVDDFKVIKAVRDYFDGQGYQEVLVSNYANIMAACEDPDTVMTFTLNGFNFPLPQTGQMNLEKLLLRDGQKKIHHLGNSFRGDVPSERRKTIFPLYEFESVGNIDDLLAEESGLMASLGFRTAAGTDKFPVVKYEEMCELLEVKYIETEEELQLEERFGPVVHLTDFPERSFPYWNMKRHSYDVDRGDDQLYYKVDVICGGQETVGSAERSCSVEEMKQGFYSNTDGGYARKLFKEFGKERTISELNDYLASDFIPRFGGGIGITRLIQALKKYDLYDAIVARYN